MRIAVDFDGVLLDRETREPIPDAFSSLRKLGREHTLLLHTCRRPGDPVIAETLRSPILRKLLIPVWRDPGKPEADLYLDDHGMRFSGDWARTMQEIRRLGG